VITGENTATFRNAGVRNSIKLIVTKLYVESVSRSLRKLLLFFEKHHRVSQQEGAYQSLSSDPYTSISVEEGGVTLEKS
jgi:hypothetical protein